MLSIILSIDPEGVKISEDNSASFASGKAFKASSAILSTPGPKALKEPEALQFGHTSINSLVSPH